MVAPAAHLNELPYEYDNNSLLSLNYLQYVTDL